MNLRLRKKRDKRFVIALVKVADASTKLADALRPMTSWGITIKELVVFNRKLHSTGIRL